VGSVAPPVADGMHQPAGSAAAKAGHEVAGALKDDAQSSSERGHEFAQRIPERARGMAQAVPGRARAIGAAAAQLDFGWARSWTARWFRENFMALVMNPILDHYTARRSVGFEKLSGISGPVIFVANHSSHMDTPVVLSALPRKLRQRTAVAAAADYFYRKRWVGAMVSLLFNTVPLQRTGGALSGGPNQVDRLLSDGWSLLIFPEGTRKHAKGRGRIHRGAAVLAAKHNLMIVPITVVGTQGAMPPGRKWPKRMYARPFSRRYPVKVSFGDPVPPQQDTRAVTDQVQHFFESAAPAEKPGRGFHLSLPIHPRSHA
jgi:1-acyl-sn-glycerol-3-phosphate acyltransferase